MNILIIHRDGEIKMSPNVQNHFSAKHADVQVFCSSGSESLKKFASSGWDECQEKVPKLTFDIVLRHGGDIHSNQSVRTAMKNALLRVAFGGSGYHYGFYLNGEFNFIRPVTGDEDTSFTLSEVEILMDYARSLQKLRENALMQIPLLPTILYDKNKDKLVESLEENLKRKHAEWLSQSFPSALENLNFLRDHYNETTKQWKVAFEKRRTNIAESLATLILPAGKLPPKTIGKKTLILWNDCIPEMRSIHNENFDFRTPGDIQNILSEDINFFQSYGVIIISAELDLPEDNGRLTPLQATKGVYLARDLRLKGCRQPIVICSVQGERDVRSRDSYDILATPGHYFFHLLDQRFYKSKPEPLPEPPDFQYLSVSLWEDIKYFHLKDGKFREIMHDMRSKIREITHEPWSKINEQADLNKLYEVIEKGFSGLKQFFREPYLLNFTKIEEIKEDIKAKLFAFASQNSHVEGDGGEILELRKEELRRLLLTMDGKSLHNAPKGWGKVLYVEDKEHDREKAIKLFERAGVACHSVGSGKEGLRVLETSNGEYPVVIVDWRLLEENGIDWQPMQGLDIIMEIASNPAKYPNPVSFFVLTDRTGGILDASKKSFPYQIHWYSKREVGRSESDFIEFANDVIQAGNLLESKFRENPSVRWEKPNGKGDKWTYRYALKEYYRIYATVLPLRGFNEANSSINTKAEKLLLDCILVLQGTEKKIPDIRRREFEFTRKLQQEDAMDDLDGFYDILIGRRVYFALVSLYSKDPSFNYEKMRAKIASLLFVGRLDWQERMREDGNAEDKARELVMEKLNRLEEKINESKQASNDQLKRIAKLKQVIDLEQELEFLIQERQQTIEKYLTNHLAIPSKVKEMEKMMVDEELEWVQSVSEKANRTYYSFGEGLYFSIIELQEVLEKAAGKNENINQLTREHPRALETIERDKFESNEAFTTFMLSRGTQILSEILLITQKSGFAGEQLEQLLNSILQAIGKTNLKFLTLRNPRLYNTCLEITAGWLVNGEDEADEDEEDED